MQEIASASTLQMVDSSSSSLIDELNEKRKTVRILPFSIAMGIVSCLVLLGVQAPLWLTGIVAVISIALCWFAGNQDAVRRTTVLLYSLESDIENKYQRLHDAFAQLGSCGGTWHISARGAVYDPKYHAGAGSLVQRQRILIRIGDPPRLKTNIQVPLAPAGRELLAFMPDRILVFSPEAVGAVAYESLGLDVNWTKFIEEEGVPRDATVVGTTWQYVNKSGGPDRRFRNNRQLPICAYEQLHFWSASGLNEILQASRHGVAEQLRQALLSMRP